MDQKVTVQPTPNPNALKFVLNTIVKSKDSAVFKRGADAGKNVIGASILSLKGVTEVYFSSHFITVTQDGSADWSSLEREVTNVIMKNIVDHNPDFDAADGLKPVVQFGNDIQKIEQILDGTIRPALQRDGGDLQIISLDGKTLTISYQGACGCCPHAAMGTLYAIQNVLRDQYDPELVVEMG